MKKVILVLACILTVGSASMTAMAHGHGGGHRYRTTASYTPTYSVCSVSGCTIAGVHQHNGAYYCGHTGDYSCGANHYNGRGHH